MTGKMLVVVDMQNDFIDGALGTKEAQAIVPKVFQKIMNWDGLIIYTKDTHYKNYLETTEGKNLPILHCVYGTKGWMLPQEIQNALVDRLAIGFEKNYFSMGIDDVNFIDDTFAYPEEIQFVGLCTDICVISNALFFKTMYPNAKISVDASCCAGVTPEKHAAAIEVMKSCQIEVIGE